MVIVAVLALVATVVVALAFARVVQSLVRQHARERDLLINQVCNLAGNPWQPPPAKEPDPIQVLENDFVYSPEHTDGYE